MFKHVQKLTFAIADVGASRGLHDAETPGIPRKPLGNPSQPAPEAFRKPHKFHDHYLLEESISAVHCCPVLRACVVTLRFVLASSHSFPLRAETAPVPSTPPPMRAHAGVGATTHAASVRRSTITAHAASRGRGRNHPRGLSQAEDDHVGTGPEPVVCVEESEVRCGQVHGHDNCPAAHRVLVCVHHGG